MLRLDQSVFGNVFKDVVVYESVVLSLHTYNPWRKAQWMAMFDMIVSMASKALSTFGLPSYQRLLLRLQCLNWVRRFHFVAGRARIRVRNKNEMQTCVFLTVGCQYTSRDFHSLHRRCGMLSESCQTLLLRILFYFFVLLPSAVIKPKHCLSRCRHVYRGVCVAAILLRFQCICIHGGRLNGFW